MPVIAAGNGYTIGTSFGSYINEGSLSSAAQGAGSSFSISVTQSPQLIPSGAKADSRGIPKARKV